VNKNRAVPPTKKKGIWFDVADLLLLGKKRSGGPGGGEGGGGGGGAQCKQMMQSILQM